MIIPLDSDRADREKAGGKAANLARLARLGYPVPPGFIVATDSYRDFVQVNELGRVIRESVGRLSGDEPQDLERASAAIRSAFSGAKVHPELRSALAEAYEELGAGAVAVRSSATLEDLPDLSFAGQQDTYLNVIGKEDVLDSVVDCWSSLWTARAIGYRIRNEVSHDEAALAVMVQAMVESEVSGVLFTANPVTGLLRESVIDATLGLGEALVSGQVEPDHFVVDHMSGSVVMSRLGEKRVSTRGQHGGGVTTVQENAAEKGTLSEAELMELVHLGQEAEKEMGRPQDIEWAIADGALYLLQSRPITSLFPVPERSFDPLEVWFSFGSVQGLVGPMTPLGRSTVRSLAAGGARTFGMDLRPDQLGLLASSGQRLWIKISDILRNPIGYRIFSSVVEMVEPSVGHIARRLASEPEIRAGKGILRPNTLIRIGRFMLPLLARSFRNLAFPNASRARFDDLIESELAQLKVTPAANRFERLENIVEFIRGDIAGSFPTLIPHFIPILAPSMAALKLLEKFAADGRRLDLEATRGLPGNVTTQMDLALWDAAEKISADDGAARVLRHSDPNALADRYFSADLPAAAQAAVAEFLEEYGARGAGEIDIGRARWREDPTPVMRTLKSYLDIRPEAAPDVQFARGQQAAEDAIEELAAAVRNTPFGFLKALLVRLTARRVRMLMGARESPKFFIIRKMGVARRALMEVGEEFVAAGEINRSDDLAFLTVSELEALAQGARDDGAKKISERRAVFLREQRRRQVPRVLVSDGRAFYEGLEFDSDDESVIVGSPVSPGTAEGTVRVVFDPGEAQLTQGEILVCPGTDPAWTPLFMVAGGLVTEVGGMMTHGSVVAREYGIPAVVGVHQATNRLREGQTIRIDGTRGRIEVIR